MNSLRYVNNKVYPNTIHKLVKINLLNYEVKSKYLLIFLQSCQGKQNNIIQRKASCHNKKKLFVV